MAEKSEKATPKKLRDARKKGQVAKSQDFPSAFTFIISISGALFMAHYIYQKLSTFIIYCFTLIAGNNIDMSDRAGYYITSALEVIFTTSVPLMVVVSVTGALVSFLIVGPLFSMEAMKPDIKRMNPITNLKNLFKVKTFVELLKSIFKIAGAFVLIYTVIDDSLGDIISTAGLPVIGSTLVFSAFLIKVVFRVGIFFIVIGILDLAFQKQNFAKEMRMEKFEVKQEYKDTEGDPQIKSKRRQAAQEIAYRDGPAATKRAKTVITNPEHIAVALEYDPETEPAPKILTMGLGGIAEAIIAVALDNNIPIMRNIDLAHILYYKGNISEYVPEETYEAIAEILKWIAKLEQEQEEVSVLEIFK